MRVRRAGLKARFTGLTAGESTYPLLVLAGLNLVDELDRTAFNILTPNIRDAFGLDLSGVLALVSLVGVAALAVEVPLAYWADRTPRVRIAAAGACLWAGFSVLTGLAPGIVVLAIARSGAGIGRAVVAPTHNSLLADYYEPDVRPKVYAVHRGANSLGMFLGPVAAGLLAAFFGWRWPFILFAIPTAVFVLLAMRLREPIRGLHERRAMGAEGEEALTEQVAPSFTEAWRILWQVRTLRRIWYAMPFLGASLVGIGAMTALFYEQVFRLDAAERGLVAALVEPAQIVGLVAGIPIAHRLGQRDPALIVRFVAVAGAVTGTCFVFLAVAPNLALAVVASAAVAAAISVVGPAMLAALSLVIPPHVRALGFSISSLWILPGLFMLPIIGSVGDAIGLRWALLLLVPIFVIGSVVVSSAHRFINADVNQVRRLATVQAAARAARLAGDPKIVLVRALDVSYGQTQVLFGVDLDVADNELVALLGTNGAGKSTLLKAICGSVEPTSGAIVVDGRDVTWMPADEANAHGIVYVPGGKGVFPTLTVAENLTMAAWSFPKSERVLAESVEVVLDRFPVLRDRWNERAGNLSGGEQQMLTLGQALISTPKLLMIDELSLGLAPAIVEQLLDVVREIHARGTTVIVVEQSVNVALAIAERAVFMEKGEVRFDGPACDLLDRPDVLRSVFLAGTAAEGSGSRSNGKSRVKAKGRSPVRRRSARELSNGGAPVLVVDDLAVSFGGILAVDGVGLELRAGEVVGLVGPNGAGKTTILDLISGYLRADRGRVAVAGVDVTHASPDARSRRGLGRSFQDARLFPSLTVTETIAGALERHVETRDPLAALLGSPATRVSERIVANRVEELVEMLGLQAFRNKFVSELSTGSRRIVDLACVLAHEPSVILLDEPSSGIAQRETEALGPLLLDIRDRSGAALLVVEHDMPLLASIADELIALNLGRVIAKGAPDAVLSNEAVTETYLGSSEAAIHRSGQTGTAPVRVRRHSR